MQVRQQKVASFFIENDDNDAAIAYIEKNAPLLKGHMLLFTAALSEALRERLVAWELCFAQIDSCKLNKKVAPKPETAIKDKKDSSDLPVVAKKREILRTIRSGESISHEGDLLICGNINDGAFIHTGGSLAIYGMIEGDIECDGEQLVLSKYRRGKISFQGEVISHMIKDERLKLIYKDDEGIKLKELE